MRKLILIFTAGLFIFSFITQAVASSEAPCTQNCDAPYVQNEFWTTAYGPAAADVIESSSNFLTCDNNPYALCYFSGPNTQSVGSVSDTPVLPCRKSEDGKSAYCKCYAARSTSDSLNYVSIGAIINTEAYIETVRACGTDGSLCRNAASDMVCSKDPLSDQCELPEAPVCSYLGGDGKRQTLVPDENVNRLSTFSPAFNEDYAFGSTDCTSAANQGLYAGCMTAPCKDIKHSETGKVMYSECKCPLFNGPYQIGQNGQQCDIGADFVWSAAYMPGSQDHIKKNMEPFAAKAKD